MWGFVSGGIEKGETEIEAAIREAKEEVNYTIDADKLIKTNKVISFISSKGQGEQIVFLYKSNSNKIEIDNMEIDEYVWFTKDEAIKK